MLNNLINFIKSPSIFRVTIIGAGIFVLPYVGLQIGFIGLAFYFIILTSLTIAVHWFLAQMVIEEKSGGTVVDYFEKYLGSKVKNFALFVSATRMVGALLIYIILGGIFLSALLSPYFSGSTFFYALLFLTVGAILVYISKSYHSGYFLNLAMLAGAFSVLLIFIVKGWPLIDSANLTGLNFYYLGPPYGIIIFSLWGLSAVPRLKENVHGDKNNYKKIIYSGIILPAIFYLLFAAVILGISGNVTSQDALTGFVSVVGGPLVKLGFIFGIAAILDSFLSIGISLKEIFQQDAKLSKKVSWFFACFLPLSLYLIKIRDIVNIMFLVGTFFYTIEAIIVILTYQKFFHLKFKKAPPRLTFLLLSAFVTILFFEFWYFFIIK